MKPGSTIILTGASGLIGRTLLDEWKNDFRIFAIARRSQQECGAPFHPNIAWMRADVSDQDGIGEAFREIATAGGADFIFHLAAFYDFSGKRHPEYYTTNVVGTRNVLHLAEDVRPELLVFTSSVAACDYPEADESINEDTPPDGEHIYSWSKREGEEIIKNAKCSFRSCIVRLGAVYTDWCEYPPLYSLLQTWLAGNWKSGILAGKGESAIPYIHIRDITSFFRRIIEAGAELPDKTVLQACTQGASSHEELFKLATRHYFGEELKPKHMPVIGASLGLRLLNLLGRITGNVPFEQPWMLRHVDRKLTVDASKTYDTLQWAPNQRHAIQRRMPYLLEHCKAEPQIWHLKNLRASRKDRDRPELRIYHIISMIEERVSTSATEAIYASDGNGRHASLAQKDRSEVYWFVRMLYRLLLTSIHSGNALLLRNYFEISSAGRFAAGYTAEDLKAVLEALNEAVIHDALEWEEPKPSKTALHQCVTMPIEFAIDEIEYQRESGKDAEAQPQAEIETPPQQEDARRQLEETIWNCLVMRK